MEQQKGYYIYYEKNPEMLRYMEKENNRHVHIVEQEDDRVVRNIRGIIKEKEHEKEKQAKKNSHLGYGIAGMVALIAILIGTVTMRNQMTLDQVKEQLRALQTMAQPQRMSEGSRTSVETQSGNLKKEQTPAPSVSATPVPSVTPTNVSGASVQPGSSETPVQSPVAK